MKKTEADKIARKLFNERNDRADQIRELARKQGRLKPGLDANKDLTKALDEEYKKKLRDLAAQIDEE